MVASAAVANAVCDALETACDKYPEVVTNDDYLDIVKRVLIGNGTSFLLGRSGPECSQFMSVGCAVSLVCIDSYSPSNPNLHGYLDTSDPKII